MLVLVSAAAVKGPQGEVKIVVITDPNNGVALTFTAQAADDVAKQITDVATQIRLAP